MRGERHPHVGVLNYYLARSDVDVKKIDKPLTLMECRKEANNVRAKLKDTLKNIKDNSTQYEHEVAATRVERRHPHLADDNSAHNEGNQEKGKQTRDREVIQENGKANKRTCKTLQSKED
jgi:hypothetical protein